MSHGPRTMLLLACWTAVVLAARVAPAYAGVFTPEKFGIGVFFGQADSTSPVEVLQCIPNGPAERAGLLPGDHLVALDTLAVDGWRLDRVLSYVSGQEPTPVALTVTRGSQQLTMRVPRMRFSDIVAGADWKYVLTADSSAYALVPLQEIQARRVGEVLPVATVMSRECKEVTLSLSSGGRPTIVYFWASWCGPCKRFISSLKQALASGPQFSRVRIVGINLDDRCATFQEWNARLEPPGEQYAGEGWHGELAQWFRISRRGIPSGALVAADGKLIRMTTGADSLMLLLKQGAVPR